jgi:hypothetical protein
MLHSAQDGADGGRREGRLRWQLQAHTDWVTAVCYAPQLKALLAAGLDKALTINDLHAQMPTKRLVVIQCACCLNKAPRQS